ncbi:MAG: SRPBCC family protein [Betaproteobacteria bacterium]|nr:SRPBCC family protein [Betaproteobacteria bacterium]
MNSSTDRIERQILLKAPLAKVWNALANAEAFGDWFGAALKGQEFAIGKRVVGKITYPGYEHLDFDVLIVDIQPRRSLSFRWHPCALDPAIDYSREETTLVEFTLAEVEGGTLLKVVESGFDKVPAGRRLEAFRMNSLGWEEQMVAIEKYVLAR